MSKKKTSSHSDKRRVFMMIACEDMMMPNDKNDQYWEALRTLMTSIADDFASYRQFHTVMSPEIFEGDWTSYAEQCLSPKYGNVFTNEDYQMLAHWSEEFWNWWLKSEIVPFNSKRILNFFGFSAIGDAVAVTLTFPNEADFKDFLSGDLLKHLKKIAAEGV